MTRQGYLPGYGNFPGYGRPSIKSCINFCINPGYGYFPGFGSSTSHTRYCKTTGTKNLIPETVQYIAFGKTKQLFCQAWKLHA